MKKAIFSTVKLSGLLFLSSLLFTTVSMAHNHATDEPNDSAETTSTLTIRNLIELSDNTFAGGQPDKTDLKLLSKKGVKTVVNVRGDGEFEEFDEAKVVAANGMNYVHIPIDSKDALNKNNVKKFRQALDASQGNALLHCGSGNRVGALFALDAYWNQNKSAEEALTIGKEAGLTSLAEHVETLLVE